MKYNSFLKRSLVDGSRSARLVPPGQRHESSETIPILVMHNEVVGRLR